MLYQKHDPRDELLNWTSAKLKKFSLQKKKKKPLSEKKPATERKY